MLTRIYYRVTMLDGDIWYASSPMIETPERTLAKVQRAAKRQGVTASYALATPAEYAAYHAAKGAA